MRGACAHRLFALKESRYGLALEVINVSSRIIGDGGSAVPSSELPAPVHHVVISVGYFGHGSFLLVQRGDLTPADSSPSINRRGQTDT